MGKDKYENEELIKYGFPEDLWYNKSLQISSRLTIFIRFHVDNYSSAHVYLRIPKGKTMDDIPPLVLEDMCQLVKANSIEGKLPGDRIADSNNFPLIYTTIDTLEIVLEIAMKIVY
jgi:hypothetical protein